MIHLKAQKSLGQNFLVDPKAHAKIVASLNMQPTDDVVEIGPGTGLLTQHLIASPLRRLIAFELDERAIPELRREFESAGDRFEVVEQDFLTVDLSELSQRIGGPLRVVGNIPYYITSPILFKLIDDREFVTDATLLMQLEVADRLAAKPSTKEYGIPTVLANFFGEVKFLFKVPAGAFRPMPKVDSAVVRLDLRRDYFTRTQTAVPPGFDPVFFRKLVRGLFGMRRKTVRNNLKGIIIAEEIAKLEHGEGAKFLGLRAEAMAIPDFLELDAMLRSMR